MIEKIKNSLNDLSVELSFTSCNYTVKQKMLMCDAFLAVSEEMPNQMIDYLSNGARKHNLQNKIFKKYISILEKSLPITYVKCGKKEKITSVEDKDLNIFVDRQEFDATVPSNGKIKNTSNDIYIGGRKGSIVKPYYFGKILDVVDINSGKSILDQVSDYTFTWIKLDGVDLGTKVKIKYLAMPPHYQMGPMVYLNRIKNKLKESLQK